MSLTAPKFLILMNQLLLYRIYIRNQCVSQNVISYMKCVIIKLWNNHAKMKSFITELESQHKHF